MTGNLQHDFTRRDRLLETAQQEMIRFERKENEFRKKDRAERAAELQLPLDQLDTH
ncbi:MULTISPECIES: hypothetical protein [Bradyrhizobium]|uniref:hypothetical protein n=1 Tax=Bradyrhizobium TaxID=374 RepID=UPI00195F0F27|nr:hypothetical protein [Bradyrhizobium canariense]MBM7486115.1 putative membrane protein YqiK [Bradyrhizobium canariense]